MLSFIKIISSVGILTLFLLSCTKDEAVLPTINQETAKDSSRNARVSAVTTAPSYVLATTNFDILPGQSKVLLQNGIYTLVHEANGSLSIYAYTNAKVRSIPIFYSSYFTDTVPSNATPFQYYWQFYGDGLVRTIGYWYNGTKKGSYIYSGAVVYNSNYNYNKLNLTNNGKLQFIFANGAVGREI